MYLFKMTERKEKKAVTVSIFTYIFYVRESVSKLVDFVSVCVFVGLVNHKSKNLSSEEKIEGI